MTNKAIFSITELNKFLLLSDPGEYLIDKLNPSIRAIKRKEILSFFCTIRIRRTTTTVKLGEFPRNNLEEIYSKFTVAKNLSNNGNNPNIVLNEIMRKKLPSQKSFFSNISYKDLLNIFFENKPDAKAKYKKDFHNCLKKNLQDFFLKPIKSMNKADYIKIVEKIISNGKVGTAKSFIYKMNTLASYFLRNENLDCVSQLKDILKLTPKFSKKYFLNQKRNNSVIRRISSELKKLNEPELIVILNKIKNKIWIS